MFWHCVLRCGVRMCCVAMLCVVMWCSVMCCDVTCCDALRRAALRCVVWCEIDAARDGVAMRRGVNGCIV